MSDERVDLTRLLREWREGDSAAVATLAALVNDELRAMARRLLAGESSANQWRATELVDEAYLRLLVWDSVEWQNRSHFFGTVAGMMRRILVDSARARNAAKRGDGIRPDALDQMQIAAAGPVDDLVALEEALERLESLNPRAAQVVEMRFFGGFSVEETAEALAISRRTVINDWNTARSWLHHQLSTSNGAAR